MGCGITFDIFTHVLHGLIFFFFLILLRYTKKKIHDDDHDDGYNVVRSVKETISLYKNNRNMLSL